MRRPKRVAWPRLKTVPLIDGTGWGVMNAIDLKIWAGPYKTRAEALFHRDAIQNALKARAVSDRERWQVVYAGFRFEPRTGDRRHLYYRVDEPGIQQVYAAASGRALDMKRELLPATPGAVLEIDVKIDDDGTVSVFAQGRSYAALNWRDREPEAVAIWVAEDRANTSLANAARSAKRTDDFDKSLSAIRDAYLGMAAPQRAQLLALVVRYIVGA